MKTKIKFISTDGYKQWEIGDTGFVDGYTQSSNGTTYCVVILDKNQLFVLAKLYHIQHII